MIKNIKGVTEIGKDTEKEQSSQQKTQKSPTNDVRSEHTPPIDTRKAKQDSDMTAGFFRHKTRDLLEKLSEISVCFQQTH